MSTPPAPSRRLPISLPIFWQVMGLSLAVLVLALVIPVLVVLKAPEPPPSGYSLTEAVTALKTGEARLQNGHRLKAATVSARPAFIDRIPAPNDVRARRLYAFQSGIAQKLAAELHVPADTVFVHLQPHRRFDGGPRTFALQRDSFMPAVRISWLRNPRKTIFHLLDNSSARPRPKIRLPRRQFHEAVRVLTGRRPKAVLMVPA